MKNEFDRFEKDIEKSNFELEKAKENFIKKLKRDKDEIKKNAGKYELKETPYIFRGLKKFIQRLKKKMRFYWHLFMIWFTK